LAEGKKYSNELRDAVFQHLLSNAHDTFFWVALVCENVTDVVKRNARKKLEEFNSGLNQLYRRMLNQFNKSNDK
jgi:hypothetical protein